MRIKPVSVIKADLGIDPGGRIQKSFVETCYRHMNKYVPYSGDANNVIHLREKVRRGATYIIYEIPHAHAQYVGYTRGPVRHYTTPGTGPHWDERMWSAEKSQVIAEVQKELKKRGNR